MSIPNGYNNPAYCHQYDSSLYDYQYVPEIDPDSPDLQENSNRKTHQIKLVRSSFEDYHPKNSSESSEFEGSDESNRSVIVEECNNRRVTLICEKRSKTDVSQNEFCQDGNFKAAYYQDISLESENGYVGRGNKGLYERGLRHQRSSESLSKHAIKTLSSSVRNNDSRIVRNPGFKQSTSSINGYQRPPRHHRYEEIPYNEECISNDSKEPASIHRYAEITVDENGYPTLSKEIKIERKRDYYPPKEKLVPKPRTISPIHYSKSSSPSQTPSRGCQKSFKECDFSAFQFSSSSPSPIIYSSSPVKTNSFEMSELSPPRSWNESQIGDSHTFFINSPKRHPPIGATSAAMSREYYALNEKCILPKNLQEISTKRCHSLPGTPKKKRDSSQTRVSPAKTQPCKKITQIFHTKANQTKCRSNAGEISKKENTSARKNISDYFTDQPNYFSVSPRIMPRSPYKPTTAEINPPKTAIITPIFQRKNQPDQGGCDSSFSPKRNFEKMSQAFQSTGNIFKSTKEAVYTGDADSSSDATQKRFTNPIKIKRNQSVPNFSQTLAAENRIITTKNQDIFEQGNDKYSRNLDLQYSPKKPVEHVSLTDKSRISLIDQASSWSNLGSDYHPQCSACFMFAAIVHLVTASATCAISFYLLSKVGRRYYLDFGILAGFVNFILGLLGFRSYCWRWLPNRNYVSGFIGLAAFSALTCAGLTYLITARPMAGDPILDIMGGAICAVSVLTIILALTGLTMSGCCKTPPPDNRVNDI